MLPIIFTVCQCYHTTAKVIVHGDIYAVSEWRVGCRGNIDVCKNDGGQTNVDDCECCCQYMSQAVYITAHVSL